MIRAKYGPLFYQKVKVPTYAELAAKLFSYQFNINNTSEIPSISRPSSAKGGQVWYSFYAVGGSLELCRINMLADGTMERELIVNVRQDSDVTRRYTQLTSDAKSLQGTASVNAHSLVLMRFAALPKVVSCMLSHLDSNNLTVLHYYYGSAYSADSADLRVKTSDVTAKTDGIAYATYRHTPSSGDGNSVFGFVNTQSSLTMIKGGDTNGWRSTSPLRGFTTSNVSYRTPSADGSNNARTKSYSLVTFQDNVNGAWV